MAIRDLLWACPICGTRGGIRTAERGSGEACRACGTAFRRGRGADILATRPDGRSEARHAAVWAERIGLPDASSLAPNDAGEILRDRVVRRRSVRQAPVHRRGRLLGLHEVYEAPEPGTLVLTSDGLRFTPDLAPGSGRAGAVPRTEVCALEQIRALSASSSAFQVRVVGPVLYAFRFPDSSLRLWEEHLCLALRAYYRSTGRGEIREFQPRIELA